MNPFDLRGQQFLVFYVALIGIASVVAWILRRRVDAERAPDREVVAWKRALHGAASGRGEDAPDLSDPYFVAFLRGGPNETLRVAMVSLVDRGLLREVTGGLESVEGAEGADASGAPPLEREILRWFKAPQDAASVFDEPRLVMACSTYTERMERAHLMPDEATRAARHRVFLAIWGALALVAGIKIAVAIARGRTNVGFLVVLAVVSAIVLWWVTHPRLTAHGRALIGDVQSLLGGLRSRASTLRPQSGSAEVALLAGAFGVGALPPESFAWVRKHFQKGAQSSCGSGGCGSASCGSSSGSSCGGGGGGCGGCGS